MTHEEKGGAPRYVAADGTVDLTRLTHDLRAPLNGILGFSRLLQEGKGGPLAELQREFVEDVLESGHNLLRVVEQLEAERKSSGPIR
jgi:signal transduction histidine kinase